MRQEQGTRMRHDQGIEKFRRRLERQWTRRNRFDRERAGGNSGEVSWEAWVIAAVVIAAFANAAAILH
jgi:hypothetical protein